MSGAQAAAPVIQVDWYMGPHLGEKKQLVLRNSGIFLKQKERHHVIYFGVNVLFFWFKLSLQKNIGILKSIFRLVLYIPGGDRWISEPSGVL